MGGQQIAHALRVFGKDNQAKGTAGRGDHDGLRDCRSERIEKNGRRGPPSLAVDAAVTRRADEHKENVRMRMLFRPMSAAIMVMACTLFCFGAQAQAAARTFVVLPFAVSGPSSLSYLEDAVPSMLNSRLAHKGRTQAISLEEKAKPVSAADDKAARTLMGKAGADYAIWGTITAQDDNATVDMRLIGQDGKQWKRTLKSPLNGLILALQRGADAINSEVFGVGQNGQAGPVGRAPMNQAFVSNEATQRQVYLNPQFRYEGFDSARQRSQTLNFAAVGMVVADVTGDGKNNVVILDEHKVVVFDWGVERMNQIGLYELPRTDEALSIHAIDLDGDGVAELVVNMLDRNQSLPFGYILSFRGGQ
ncbi:MAG: VCBS repeat-containing protein, partial [Deltaproteobacteria bacterium]|nr:VCBS repeat-containing protein [Deltaproteobacteria bacterium]